MPEERVVIITGASSGIGAASARLLGGEGFRVALAARRMERLEALADEIAGLGGTSLPIQTDVSELDAIDHMVGTTLHAWGRIDILVNNAGLGRFGWLEELAPVDDIEKQLRVNLLGTILCTRAVLPHMIEQRRGHVINMASLAGLVATPTYSIYAASKFAMRGFTQALRREVGVWGIKVSAIYPAGVATEFARKSGVEKRKTGISTPPFLKKSAEDIARTVYKVIQRPRSIVVVPWLMRYAIWLNNMVPGLVDKIIERRFVRPERGL